MNLPDLVDVQELYVRDAMNRVLDNVAAEVGLSRAELDAFLACCRIEMRPV